MPVIVTPVYSKHEEEPHVEGCYFLISCLLSGSQCLQKFLGGKKTHAEFLRVHWGTREQSYPFVENLGLERLSLIFETLGPIATV